jgi:hypothetical protein
VNGEVAWYASAVDHGGVAAGVAAVGFPGAVRLYSLRPWAI